MLRCARYKPRAGSRRLSWRTGARQVYGWFLGLYKVSVAAGLGGYLLLVLEVFGIGLLLRPAGVPATLSLLLVWCVGSDMLPPGACLT